MMTVATGGNLMDCNATQVCYMTVNPTCVKQKTSSPYEASGSSFSARIKVCPKRKLTGCPSHSIICPTSGCLFGQLFTCAITLTFQDIIHCISEYSEQPTVSQSAMLTNT